MLYLARFSTVCFLYGVVYGYCGVICAGNDNCQKIEMGRSTVYMIMQLCDSFDCFCFRRMDLLNSQSSGLKTFYLWLFAANRIWSIEDYQDNKLEKGRCKQNPAHDNHLGEGLFFPNCELSIIKLIRTKIIIKPSTLYIYLAWCLSFHTD